MLRPVAFAFATLLLGCSSSGDGTTGTTGGTTGSTGGGGASASSHAASTAASSGSGGAGAGAPTAADLLALTQACNQVSNGLYKTDDEAQKQEIIPICGLQGAVYWKADMDVDCDGKTTAQCNINTDPAYQNQTSATDSHNDPLDAANLPFVVVPLPSTRFDYHTGGLHLGSVIAVIYKGQVEYGVFGDEGPSNIIGEASYAMAKSLGIDPDPSFGGTGSGVTYIAFTGSSAVQAPIEDHAGATTLGESLAKKLIANN